MRKKCAKCKHLKQSKVYTADSFDNIEKWVCGKTDILINSYVDTFDNVETPFWCPISNNIIVH